MIVNNSRYTVYNLTEDIDSQYDAVYKKNKSIFPTCCFDAIYIEQSQYSVRAGR